MEKITNLICGYGNCKQKLRQKKKGGRLYCDNIHCNKKSFSEAEWRERDRTRMIAEFENEVPFRC